MKQGICGTFSSCYQSIVPSDANSPSAPLPPTHPSKSPQPEHYTSPNGDHHRLTPPPHQPAKPRSFPSRAPGSIRVDGNHSCFHLPTHPPGSMSNPEIKRHYEDFIQPIDPRPPTYTRGPLEPLIKRPNNGDHNPTNPHYQPIRSSTRLPVPAHPPTNNRPQPTRLRNLELFNTTACSGHDKIRHIQESSPPPPQCSFPPPPTTLKTVY